MNTANGQSLASSDQGVRKKAKTNLVCTYGQILDADFRRVDSKRKRYACDDIPLGDGIHDRIKIYLLGPSLKKRFFGGRTVGVTR